MIQRDISLFDNAGKRPRDIVGPILDFLRGEQNKDGRILTLFGLRRTGKTTAIEQALTEYNSPDACAFYEVEEQDDIQDVKEKIIQDKRRGVRVVCFDEITRATGFITNSAVLSDVFAKEGMKIIVTGTDSLGILFAENHQLFDRTVSIRTTHIPFAEHCRVLGTDDMDDYIQYGGLMARGRDGDGYVHGYLSARKYLDEAVSENIAHSIALGREPTDLERFSPAELRTIIEKMVEIYSGTFKAADAQGPLRAVSVNYPVHKLYGIASDVVLEKLIYDERHITPHFSRAINADAPVEAKVTDRTMRELERYLMDLDVLSVTKTTPLRYEDGIGWRQEPSWYEYYIVQPAIKYYHLMKGREFIQNEPYYAQLTVSERAIMQQKLDEKIMGDMTEQIVLFDTRSMLSSERYEVIKPVFYRGRNMAGEYDMLICDRVSGEYHAFEIKHTTEPYFLQEKHLIDEDFKTIVDRQFGRRKTMAVLYRGKPFRSEAGTSYLNMTDFLLAVERHHDIADAMAELTENLSEVQLQPPGDMDDPDLSDILDEDDLEL